MRSHPCLKQSTLAGNPPPEPDPHPLIDKVYPTGSPEGPRVLRGAAKSLTNDHGLHRPGGGPPWGTPTLWLSSAPPCSIAVGGPMTRGLHGAATQHFEFTRNSTLNDQIILSVCGVTTSDCCCSMNNNNDSIITMPGRKCLASSAPNSYNTDPCVWTAVCMAHSWIHPNHDLGHGLQNCIMHPSCILK